MDSEREPWKCEGTIAKYGRPCPQKYGFFKAGTSKETIALVKEVFAIKCSRCGTITSGS